MTNMMTLFKKHIST